MWFWLSLITLLCWSGSDLFSKIGCRDSHDRYSHLKMVIAVGTVMGIHAAYEIFVGGTEINLSIIWTYLPVSLLYIGSMTLGYLGLRYIELSISSPICNSSGAIVAILAILTGGIGEFHWLVFVAVALVCAGVIGLGIVESHEDDELRELEIVHAIARMDNALLYDELIQDEDVLINGEEEYGADCSAEFTGMFSCYLVWFKEV